MGLTKAKLKLVVRFEPWLYSTWTLSPRPNKFGAFIPMRSAPSLLPTCVVTPPVILLNSVTLKVTSSPSGLAPVPLLVSIKTAMLLKQPNSSSLRRAWNPPVVKLWGYVVGKYPVRLKKYILEVSRFEQVSNAILDYVVFGPCQAVHVNFINTRLQF